MKALHMLLRKSIDYAGLFPPAGLDLGKAVANYAAYLAGPDAWALGRFVVPASQLSELARALPDHARNTQPWHLAALAGRDVAADLDAIAGFNQIGGPARVNAFELKAGTPREIAALGRLLPDHLQAYIEIPIDRDPASLVAAIEQVGRWAKVRTGGVTRDAFPSPANLIRFITACVEHRVPFKATAGLHHPLRAEYRLTYEPDSERGTMFGFLNLFLAAAFLAAGMDRQQVVMLLEERSLEAFQVDAGQISWAGAPLSGEDIRRAREEVIHSFGSCSFTEPLSELQELHLLEPGVPQA